MATNMVYKTSDQLPVKLAASGTWPALSAGAAAGAAIYVGRITGVALTTAIAAVGETVIRRKGVFRLAVKGTSDGASTGATITAGEALYINTNGVIDKNDSAVPFGYALEDVESGATATIRVLLR